MILDKPALDPKQFWKLLEQLRKKKAAGGPIDIDTGFTYFKMLHSKDEINIFDVNQGKNE